MRFHQGAVDIGQGSNTVITQICADALGAPLRLFDLVSRRHRHDAGCGKTSASRQTFVSGNAAESRGDALRAADPAARQCSDDGAAICFRRRRASRSRARYSRTVDLAAPAGRRRGFVLERRRDLRSADHAARRRRPGRSLCGLRLWRASRRGRGRSSNSARVRVIAHHARTTSAARSTRRWWKARSKAASRRGSASR